MEAIRIGTPIQIVETNRMRITIHIHHDLLQEIGIIPFPAQAQFLPDNAELKRKAALTGLTETAVFRLLLRSYEPKEKPDGRFYDAMRELSAIGNNINQLAAKANTLGFIDAPMLRREAERWHRFQADIEAVYLRPGASKLKWN